MIQNRRLISIITLLSCLMSMTGCSDTDSSYEQTAETTCTTLPIASAEQTTGMLYEKKGTFKSIDGTVEYTWDIATDAVKRE